MTPNDWAKLIAFLAVFVLPVLAVTIILTSRLVLKPIVEAVLRLREGMDVRPAPPGVEVQRIAAVEDELHQLRGEVRQLHEAVDFHTSLRAGEPAPLGTAARLPAPGRPALRVEGRPPRDTPPVENAGDYAQEYE
jgi:hypothetical protein